MKWNEIQIQQLKSYVAALESTWAGRFLYTCFPFKKKCVIKNMRLVFGAILSESEIKKLALGFYSHIATSIKEVFLMRFMSPEELKQKAEVLSAAGTEVKGIVLTGHFGNWEFGPIAMGHFKQHERRFYFIRKPIKYIDKFLFRLFNQAGLEIIPKKGALKRVCSALKKDNIVVFVMDQYASIPKDGIAVDFFGKKTGTFKSLAMIAGHMKVPVFPARCYRRKSDGKHIVEFFEPLRWLSSENLQEEIAINTRQYNEVLEQFILDYPEQWNWMHRRWRNI